MGRRDLSLGVFARMAAPESSHGLGQRIGLADYWRVSGQAPDDARWMPARVSKVNG